MISILVPNLLELANIVASKRRREFVLKRDKERKREGNEQQTRLALHKEEIATIEEDNDL